MGVDQDILNMSDEEFAKLPTPSVTSEESEEQKEESEQPETPAADTEQDNSQVDQNAEPKAEDTEPEPKPEDPKPEEPAAPIEEPEKPKDEDKEPEKTEDKPQDPPKPEEQKTDKSSQYEAFFKQVMAPFKANGKMIQLNSPEEVIQLMQMGANYTQKMQSIQKNKKYLLMLENNNLLDEGKLSFLIDLDKKNPEAIKKFMKDSKIDPSEIDVSEEARYTGGGHVVTDQEAALASVIDELNSSAEGKTTLQSVHTWDATSKKMLYDDPRILSVIHSQHENGIYAKIVAELERRKILGQVSPTAPFLESYKLVGDDMNAKGAFGLTKPAAAPSKPAAGTPVAVKPAKNPAAKAQEAAKVRAAASPRSSAQPARADINVLAMSDDEFLKKYGNKY